ncbi:MAG: glycoside hydrolase family 48 protein [Bacillota bacterium]|nr:glycoside hydrolase family 48 protein [Bacillota bacterium]
MLRTKKIASKVAVAALTASMSLALIPYNVFAATTPAQNTYQQRFETMYKKIHTASNGYFNANGVPYHSVETFMVEAPDYGHESTSEAFSYYMWLEAMHGSITGDFAGFKTAWDTTEKYIIPSHDDQPAQNTTPSATYAGEYEEPSMYPSKFDKNIAQGTDPLYSELKSAYNTGDIYAMHWITDPDNWYGFGAHEDGSTSPENVYFNTYQRGPQESVFETIPQPSWDALKFGSTGGGFLTLFTNETGGNPATNTASVQYKYTEAPDADSRAVQATYVAYQAAKKYGVDLSAQVAKASKLGDYLRYSMMDKYFRVIGDPSKAGTGKDAMHYLLSWYYAWGGDAGPQHGWSWRIGCSHIHFGYQNPLAAYILSTNTDFEPKSQTASADWSTSLKTQIQFYQWLQSSEGAIAGGASNSNNGRYEAWPTGTSTFDGMGYVENPVYLDPGSNTWFGMQVWSMQRMIQYYYESKDPSVKPLIDKWAKWANSTIKFNADGTFQIPSTITWKGQPDTWTGTASANTGLHVEIVDYSTDLGTSSSLANALTYYAKATGDATSKKNAKEILDRIWNKYQDTKGISSPEAKDFSRVFNQTVYVPDGWTGTYPNGDKIQTGIKFIDIRSKYKLDPDYTRIKADVDAGKSSTMYYHRFWAQSEYAIANAVYGQFFNDAVKGDVNGDGKVNVLDYLLLNKYLKNTSIKISTTGADVNGDGSITSADYSALRTKLIKR